MENASKALLITAAVLIVILLVAFGMKIFNSTKGTQDSATTTGKAISAAVFNAKFKPYIGKGQSSDNVFELLEIIEKNNEKNGRKVNVTIIIAKEDLPLEEYADIVNKQTKYKSITSIKRDMTDSLQNGKEIYKNLNVYVYYDKDGYIGLIALAKGRDVYIENYDNKMKAQ